MNELNIIKTDKNDASMVLTKCHDLMSQFLQKTLNTMMDEIDDVLLDIAIKTTSSEERTKYFNAMHELRLKRYDIENYCLTHFLQNIEKSTEQKEELIKQEYSLDADDELLSIQSTIKKLKAKCRLVINKIEERIDGALKNQSISKKLVSPEDICLVFYEASNQLNTDQDIKTILFKYFENHIASGLNDIYLESDNAIKQEIESLRQSHITNEVKAEGLKNNTDVVQRTVSSEQFAQSEILSLFEGKKIPEFISDFLMKHWVTLLVKIHDKAGTNNDSWKHAIVTVEDLIFLTTSITKQDKEVKSESSTEELWSDVIMRLHNGMRMVSVTSSEEEAFMAQLMKCKSTHSMLGSLTKSQKSDVSLITPEKIQALKSQVPSEEIELQALSEKDLSGDDISSPNYRNYETIGDDDLTIPGSEDITIPIRRVRNTTQPFMNELLVDNQNNVSGFKTDLEDE